MSDKDIIIRFFGVIRWLISEKRIRGIATFTNRYGINRRNFQQLEKDLAKLGVFKPCWLSYLVNDYGISADYLLTGNGKISADM